MISVQALVVARRPEYEKAKRANQQQTQSHAQAQASLSHPQPADTLQHLLLQLKVQSLSTGSVLYDYTNHTSLGQRSLYHRDPTVLGQCKAAKYDEEMTELRHYGNLTLEQKGYDKSLCSLPATRGTNPSAKDGVIRFPHLHDPIHCHFL
ncbi:hypothetical protein F4604DRAFT_1908119 [Suillus subluteus]|nr:hypothetical protein F4604DRAFT_1908119 [Suillus subluteus]